MYEDQEILHVYEEESGQQINKEKNTVSALRDHVKATLNAQVTTQ